MFIKFLSENNFMSYWLPFGYTYLLLLASRPDGTRNVYIFSSVCCVYCINMLVSSFFWSWKQLQPTWRWSPTIPL